MIAARQSSADFEHALAEGRICVEAGDYTDGIQVFLDVWQAWRRVSPKHELMALSSLATAAGRAGHLGEALAFSRRMLVVARRHRARTEEIQALAFIANAYASLRAWEHLDAPLHALAIAIEAHRMPPRSALLLLHECRAEQALGAAQVEDAKEAIQAYRAAGALEDVGLPLPLLTWNASLLDARVALVEGDADRAQALLDQGGEEPPVLRDDLALQRAQVGVDTAVARGEAAAVRTQVERLLDRMRRLTLRGALASQRVLVGAHVARTLAGLGDHDDLLATLHDLVAGAVIARIHEIDAAHTQLSGLPIGEAPEDLTVLGDLRRRFVEEQSDVLARIARYFEGVGPRILDDLTAAGGGDVVRLCAWCERLRLADDRWIPVGHYVPRDAHLEVTHGICPACLKAQTGGRRG